MRVQVKPLFGGLEEIPAGADPRAAAEGLIRQLETDADGEHYQVAVVYDERWGVTIGRSGLAVRGDMLDDIVTIRSLYRRLGSRDDAVELLEDVARGHMDHVRSLDWVKEDELPEKTVEVFPWVRPPFPVHKAAFKGILEEVKRLLAAGSDVNQRDADGATPLMHAVAGGREAVCRLLIEHGADLTVRDNEGWTVLKLAKAYPAIVAMLKRAGATE